MADQSIWRRLWALRGKSFSKAQQFAILMMVFPGLIALAMPFTTLSQHLSATDLMEVPAKVVSVEEKCDLLAKGQGLFSLGGFEFVRTTSCAEADLFISASTDAEWKSERKNVVTLDYVASGVPQTASVAAERFDVEGLSLGAMVPLYVNPNKLDDVRTGISSGSIIITAIVTLASLLLCVLGWLMFNWLTPELNVEEDQDNSIE